MTYEVNLKDTGQDMLLGLLNYDNNPSNVPHQDLWDKSVITIYDAEGLIEDAFCIAPTATFEAGDKWVYKKLVGFETDTAHFKIHADDYFELYIDGVKVASSIDLGTNSRDLVELSFPVTLGEHTISFVHWNGDSGGYLEFAIFDGDELREASDTSWPCLISDGTYPISEMVKRGWFVLTDDNVICVKPPVLNDDQIRSNQTYLSYSYTGNLYSKRNYADRDWPRAVVFTGATGWEKPDELCKYIAPTPTYNTSFGIYYLKKRIIVQGNSFTFEAAADDYWRLYVDGVKKGEGSSAKVQSVTVPVTPGEHTFVVEVENGVSGPALVSFRITDSAGPIHRSDTTWACCEQGTNYASAVQALHTFTVPSTHTYDVGIVDDDKADVSYQEVTKVNGDETTVNIYVNLATNQNALATVLQNPKVAVLNSTVTMVTKLPEYGVKNVDVNYNRIGLGSLFADVMPVGVREINLTHAAWDPAVETAARNMIAPTYDFSGHGFQVKNTFTANEGDHIFSGSVNEECDIYVDDIFVGSVAFTDPIRPEYTVHLDAGEHTIRVQVRNKKPVDGNQICRVDPWIREVASGNIILRGDETWLAVETDENDVPITDGAELVIDYSVLAELNRRYGVNFTEEDFRVTLGGVVDGKHIVHIQGREGALAFFGTLPIEVINSLTTRVPNRILVGFTRDNTILV